MKTPAILWLLVPVLVTQVGIADAQTIDLSSTHAGSGCLEVLAESDDWMLGPRKTRALGKILSYRLNAYDDYLISELLADYACGDESITVVDSVTGRAHEFVLDMEDLERTPDINQKIMVRAFALRWLNGYADLMWARFLEKAWRIDPMITSRLYGDAETGRIDLFYWSFAIRGDTRPVREFVTQYLPLTISPDDIATEIIHVQLENGDANLQTRALLLGDAAIDSALPNAKAEFLLEISELTRHPRSFLRGAAKGQAAAKQWDRLFASLCRNAFARRASKDDGIHE